MKSSYKKHAYTLAEIMVVLLVLTIIFAACAPFFTKRQINRSNNIVWEFADLNSYDAYTKQGAADNTGQLFFGLTPGSGSDVEALFSPLSKLVIRSGLVTDEQVVQRQIQFRYGDNTPDGTTTNIGNFSGTWMMDGKNILMGGRYINTVHGSGGARQNVAIGYDALTNLTTGSNNTAVGYNALVGAKTAKDNVAIGYNAGRNGTDFVRNTFAGANAGAGQTGSDNTIIGYYAAGYGSGTGEKNTYIGATAGANNTTGSKNVAIGYNALRSITTGTYNIAVGYNALGNLTTGHYNVAIGYNACAEVNEGSYKTCIGANSGPHTGKYNDLYYDNDGSKTNGHNRSKSTAAILGGADDDVQRTYIGSKPYYFGGDAVLEIHNPNNNVDISKNGMTKYLGATPSNTTTIVNGNLIIRGRAYFTSGTTLYHMHDQNFTNPTDYKSRVYGVHSNDQICSTSAVNYHFGSQQCVQWPTSDRRLKNIGTRSTAGLAKINQLKIYNYTFKADKDKLPHVGVMAQDLQKIFPNSVFKDDKGYLRIKWDEMFYAAINAVKELDNKITILFNRFTKTETQISKLEKENLLLKTQVDTLTKRVNQLKNQ